MQTMKRKWLGLLVVASVLSISALKAQAASTTWTTTAPTVNEEDIYNFFGATTNDVPTDLENVKDPALAAGDDEATYIAGDRPDQGQSFTTGSHPDGYLLKAITIKHAQYDHNHSIDAGWEPYADFAVRVGTVSGGVITPLLTEVAPIGDGGYAAGNTFGGSDNYITFELDEPYVLDPNTEYGYVVGFGPGGPYFDTAGTSNDVVSGAAIGYGGGIGGGTSKANIGDRVFHLDIAKNTPVKVTGYPKDGATNNVFLTAICEDVSSEFSSASLYLDSFSNPIADTETDLGGGTNKVEATSGVMLDPETTHTAYIIVNAINPAATFTNQWEFTMGEGFYLNGSPEGFALDYDFAPTAYAEILEVADTVDFISFRTNGVAVSATTEPPNGDTQVVSVAYTTLEPGTTVTNTLIVSGVNYGLQTNEWTFTMGGDVGVTVWNSTDPTPGADDVYSFDAPADDFENLSQTTNGSADVYTYVAGNQPGQGQLFTTPNVYAGYELKSVWLRNTPYTNATDSVGVWQGAAFKVRITDPSKAGTAGFVLHTSSTNMVALNGGLEPSDGRWLEFTLEKPIVLAPNTQYGFDVESDSPWFNTSGVTNNAYPAGNAYTTTPTNNVTPGNTITNLTGDRTFMVELTESTEPFAIAVSPQQGATGVANPPSLEVEVTQTGGTFDEPNSKLFFNGVEVGFSVSGSGPYTLTTAALPSQQPGSVCTGAYEIASSSPIDTLSGSWTFTIGDAFSFEGQVPAVNDFLFTNATPLSVEIVNIADTLSGATLYLDDVDTGATASLGSPSNSIGIASTGALDPGYHTAMVVAEGSFGDITNSWSFEVIGGAGITVWTTTDPDFDGDDIKQFTSEIIDEDNVGGGSLTVNPDEYNYCASDRPIQGQTFTTSNSVGSEVSSVWLRHVGYSTYSSLNQGDFCTLRIVDLARDGTDGFVVYQEDLQVKNDNLEVFGDLGSGKWIEFKLSTPVVLKGNHQYGFDVKHPSYSWNYWETAGTFSSSAYTGGNAYISGAGQEENIGDNTYTNLTGNRTFLVELDSTVEFVPTAEAAFSVLPSPVGVITDGTSVSVEAAIVDQNVDPYLDEVLNSAALYVDGGFETSTVVDNGGTNVITASSATYAAGAHTAMVIMTGTQYPGNQYTNEWSFTVGEVGEPGKVISWNWDNNGTVAPSNFAGVVSASNWFNSWPDFPTDPLTNELDNLEDNNGAITSMDVAWEYSVANPSGFRVVGYHPGPDGDGTANMEMVNGYLDAFGGSNSVISLSEIPYTDYDIIVYFSSDNGGRIGSVSDGTTTYHFNTVGGASIWGNYGSVLLAEATDTTLNGTNSAANYAIFSGLTGASQTITVAPDYADEFNGMGIAAFQVVDRSVGGPAETTLSVSGPSGGVITISWPAADGNSTVVTNGDLCEGTWNPYGMGSLNVDVYEVNIPTDEDQLFFKTE